MAGISPSTDVAAASGRSSSGTTPTDIKTTARDEPKRFWPTDHFDLVARHRGFHDGRVVANAVVLVGCLRTQVLDESLRSGRDVADLRIDPNSCASVIGSAGDVLAIYAQGAGLIGVDVSAKAVRWRLPIRLAGECGWDTCPAAVVSGDKVIAWESSGEVVARWVATGATAWKGQGAPTNRWTQLVADEQGHVIQPIPSTRTLRGYDAMTGRVLWERVIDPIPTYGYHRLSLPPNIVEGNVPTTLEITEADRVAITWSHTIGKAYSGVWVERVPPQYFPKDIVVYAGDDGSDDQRFEPKSLNNYCRLWEPTFIGPRTALIATIADSYTISNVELRYVMLNREEVSWAWRPVRSKPIADDQSVFVLGDAGELTALDLRTGRVQWTFGILGREGSSLIRDRPAAHIGWVHGDEVLLGLGSDAQQADVVYAFRKGPMPMTKRTLAVEGQIEVSENRNWGLPNEWKIGGTSHRVDDAGHLSENISGRGSYLMAIEMGSWASNWGRVANPPFVAIDFESGLSRVEVPVRIQTLPNEIKEGPGYCNMEWVRVNASVLYRLQERLFPTAHFYGSIRDLPETYSGPCLTGEHLAPGVHPIR
jgi:outer membrane protein assembly factor BamB